MGKGSPNNSAAIQLQQQSLAESKVQNKAMLALLQQQVDAAKTLQLPNPPPPMPLPQNTGADATDQLQETRRNLLKRDGLAATSVVPMTPVAPLRSAMGTPMFGMAA